MAEIYFFWGGWGAGKGHVLALDVIGFCFPDEGHRGNFS